MLQRKILQQRRQHRADQNSLNQIIIICSKISTLFSKRIISVVRNLVKQISSMEQQNDSSMNSGISILDSSDLMPRLISKTHSMVISSVSVWSSMSMRLALSPSLMLSVIAQQKRHDSSQVIKSSKSMVSSSPQRMVSSMISLD